MTTPASPYEYRGPKAAYWDLLRGDTSKWEDRPFYWAAIKASGEPALDVGCGTGRLLLDFLGQGIDIDGIDNSADMLAILRRKAERMGVDVTGRIHLQRMEQLDLPRRYRTIIVPSSSFQLLVAERTAAEAMRRFVQHLEPGGTLGMPFIVFDSAAERRWTCEARLEDGSLVRRTAWSRYEPASRLEATEDIYEVFRNGEPIRRERFVRPTATRAWSVREARALFDDAGFVDIETLSNFPHEPYR